MIPMNRETLASSSALLVLIACLPAFISARTFTVTNQCSFTIWPALFTDRSISQSAPDQATGWEAAPNSSVSFPVPDGWKAGRIWGRRDCDFSTNPGPNSCATGGCNGGLRCDNTTGTGVPPVSVAEWTLQGDQNEDFYDVSLVDGFDLPMRVDNDVGCPVADCPVDLNPSCPAQLQGAKESNGTVLGCKSACSANLDGNQANSPNCCSGQFASANNCPSSGVEFYSYFKSNCPNSYAYAFDESSNTALWTCDSSKSADYTLTFCPSNSTTAQPTSGTGSASTSTPTESSTTNSSEPPTLSSVPITALCVTLLAMIPAFLLV